MKDFNVEEAASWDEQEFHDNIIYLETRARYEEAERAKAVRAGTAEAAPKPRTRSTAKKEAE
jgi:hypothetical protein